MDTKNLDNLSSRQVALVQALVSIADIHGKFSWDTTEEGAHYTPAMNNPFKAEGLVCKNCVFYAADSDSCSIVMGDIDEEAICKFWVIPNDQIIVEMPSEQTASTESAPIEQPVVELATAEVKADTFIPPDAVAKNAKQALEVRDSKPASEQGMTLVGLARANQLANKEPVSLQTIQRMVAYFNRHEVDKEGSTWSEQGKGWQAWMGWGGDEGRAWAEGILKNTNMEAKMDFTNADWTIAIDMKDGMFRIKTGDREVTTDNIQDALEMLEMWVEDGSAAPLMAEAEMEAAPADTAEDDAEMKVTLTAAERDALPDEDFAIPSSRNFPINSPIAVSDAVAGWGRYEGTVAFETFKQNLIAIAKRKGPEYVAALPQSWRDELAAAETKRTYTAEEERKIKSLAKALVSRIR